MEGNKTYYVRARHRGLKSAEGAWSDASIFTTKSSLPSLETALIVAPDAAASDNFGTSVALSGDGGTLAVGSPYSDGTLANAGAVYIYKKSGTSWVFYQRIVAMLDSSTEDRSASARFGHSVSLNNNGRVLAVGEPYRTDTYVGSGRVYIYKDLGTVFHLEQKITSPLTIANAYFGLALKITQDGTKIVVGAPYYNSSRGRVITYNYTGGTWTLRSNQGCSSNTTGKFGFSVDISDSGNRVIAGEPDVGNGRVVVLDWNGSAFTETWNNLYSETSTAQFGYSVAVSGDGVYIAIGIPKRDQGVDNGSVEIWRWEGSYFTVHYYSHYDNAGPNWGFILQSDVKSDYYYLGFSVDTNHDGTIFSAGNGSANGHAPVLLIKRSETGVMTGTLLNRVSEQATSGFGKSLCLDYLGATLAVGALTEDKTLPTVTDSGVVRIFS